MNKLVWVFELVFKYKGVSEWMSQWVNMREWLNKCICRCLNQWLNISEWVSERVSEGWVNKFVLLMF